MFGLASSLVTLLAASASAAVDLQWRNCAGLETMQAGRGPCLSDCTGTQVVIPGAKGVDLITGITLGQLTMTFNGGDSTDIALQAPGTAISLAIPQPLRSGAMLNFESMSSAIILQNSQSAPMATLNVENVPSSGNSVSGKLNAGIVGTAVVTSQSTMSDFIRQIAGGTGSFLIQFGGMATTTVTTATDGPSAIDRRGLLDGEDVIALNETLIVKRQASSVPFCLHYVPIPDVSAPLLGMGWFPNSFMSDVPLVVGGDPTNGIQLQLTVNLNNPSNIHLIINDAVTFDMTFNGGVVGSVHFASIDIPVGASQPAQSTFFHPASDAASQAAGAALLSGFTMGRQDMVVTITNGRTGKGSALLDGPLSQAQITIPLKTRNNLLIQSASYLLPDVRAHPLQTTGTILARNPFDTTVTITHIKSTVLVQGNQLATVDQDVSASIPAQGTASIPVNMFIGDLTPFNIAYLANLPFNSATPVDIGASVLTLSIGGYTTTLNYEQPGVPATVINRSFPSFTGPPVTGTFGTFLNAPVTPSVSPIPSLSFQTSFLPQPTGSQPFTPGEDTTSTAPAQEVPPPPFTFAPAAAPAIPTADPAAPADPAAATAPAAPVVTAAPAVPAAPAVTNSA
ncbi:hypothetical protein BDK51DRAFT_27493 [Blyttiomyces helicus]|uniref:Uncharacterized protein n=1 Tax=Blyttiomyces helicus TaxID=388810 RepID=A0A4P9W8N5_9FUNG|nr:hypothetical protein BDK51DRAFT_27493 [Blyttiomyces helicus]|eukprot:RKO88724.1 hypothetical protein BDK51DRAFT_27493 [Blyttiomyces helicus]